MKGRTLPLYRIALPGCPARLLGPPRTHALAASPSPTPYSRRPIARRRPYSVLTPIFDGSRSPVLTLCRRLLAVRCFTTYLLSYFTNQSPLSILVYRVVLFPSPQESVYESH